MANGRMEAANGRARIMRPDDVPWLASGKRRVLVGRICKEVP